MSNNPNNLDTNKHVQKLHDHSKERFENALLFVNNLLNFTVKISKIDNANGKFEELNLPPASVMMNALTAYCEILNGKAPSDVFRRNTNEVMPKNLSTSDDQIADQAPNIKLNYEYIGNCETTNSKLNYDHEAEIRAKAFSIYKQRTKNPINTESH